LSVGCTVHGSTLRRRDRASIHFKAPTENRDWRRVPPVRIRGRDGILLGLSFGSRCAFRTGGRCPREEANAAIDLGRDITGASERKYLFPTGLPGTGRYLLNGQNAVTSKRVCMGEGGFDVFAMKAAFDEEVELRGVTCVGSFGKHLSYGDMAGDDQLGRLLKLRAHGLEDLTILWGWGRESSNCRRRCGLENSEDRSASAYRSSSKR
jgi:hypothetical protein